MDFEGQATLTDVYDTAVNPGRWRRALDGVAASVGARGAALVLRGSSFRRREVTMLSSVYLDFSRTAAGLYYGLWLDRWQRADWAYLSDQPAHLPIPDTVRSDRDTLDSRPDYAFLRRKIGVLRRMGVRLNADRLCFDAMSLGFDDTKGFVPPAGCDRLRPFLPHLTKAVELGRTFMRLRERYKAALSAIDRVQVGMAVALPSGELLFENAEAKRILEQKDGLRKASDGHLRAADPDLTAAISQAIGEASETAAGRAGREEALFAIPRRSDAAPLMVEVAPLKDSAAELDLALEGAMVTLIDPASVPPINIKRFAAAYGLTAAESAVCTLLLAGCTIPEVAERRGTSPVTVKNQAGAIMAKAGVGRRSDLVRLILRVLPPVT